MGVTRLSELRAARHVIRERESGRSDERKNTRHEQNSFTNGEDDQESCDIVNNGYERDKCKPNERVTKPVEMDYDVDSEADPSSQLIDFPATSSRTPGQTFSDTNSGNKPRIPSEFNEQFLYEAADYAWKLSREKGNLAVGLTVRWLVQNREYEPTFNSILADMFYGRGISDVYIGVVQAMIRQFRRKVRASKKKQPDTDDEDDLDGKADHDFGDDLDMDADLDMIAPLEQDESIIHQRSSSIRSDNSLSLSSLPSLECLTMIGGKKKDVILSNPVEKKPILMVDLTACDENDADVDGATEPGLDLDVSSDVNVIQDKNMQGAESLEKDSKLVIHSRSSGGIDSMVERIKSKRKSTKNERVADERVSREKRKTCGETEDTSHMFKGRWPNQTQLIVPKGIDLEALDYDARYEVDSSAGEDDNENNKPERSRDKFPGYIVLDSCERSTNGQNRGLDYELDEIGDERFGKSCNSEARGKIESVCKRERSWDSSIEQVKRIKIENSKVKPSTKSRLDTVEAGGEGNDTCGMCGEGGILVMCSECEKAYHFSCSTPPYFPEHDVKDWYCGDCLTYSNDDLFRRMRKNLFRALIFDRDLPSRIYSVPREIAEMFEGVRCTKDGDYEDNPPAINLKVKNRNGFSTWGKLSSSSPSLKEIGSGTGEYEDEIAIRDSRKLKEFVCVYCKKGKLEGTRELGLICCDECGSFWHLECVDPPMANPPMKFGNGKFRNRWICPRHVGKDLRDLAKRLKGGRIMRNRRTKDGKGCPGHIDIADDSDSLLESDIEAGDVTPSVTSGINNKKSKKDRDMMLMMMMMKSVNHDGDLVRQLTRRSIIFDFIHRCQVEARLHMDTFKRNNEPLGGERITNEPEDTNNWILPCSGLGRKRELMKYKSKQIGRRKARKSADLIVMDESDKNV